MPSRSAARGRHEGRRRRRAAAAPCDRAAIAGGARARRGDRGASKAPSDAPKCGPGRDRVGHTPTQVPQTPSTSSSAPAATRPPTAAPTAAATPRRDRRDGGGRVAAVTAAQRVAPSRRGADELTPAEDVKLGHDRRSGSFCDDAAMRAATARRRCALRRRRAPRRRRGPRARPRHRHRGRAVKGRPRRRRDDEAPPSSTRRHRRLRCGKQCVGARRAAEVADLARRERGAPPARARWRRRRRAQLGVDLDLRAEPQAVLVGRVVLDVVDDHRVLEDVDRPRRLEDGLVHALERTRGARRARATAPRRRNCDAPAGARARADAVGVARRRRAADVHAVPSRCPRCGRRRQRRRDAAAGAPRARCSSSSPAPPKGASARVPRRMHVCSRTARARLV